jgi:Fe2+ transport system protein FeoA
LFFSYVVAGNCSTAQGQITYDTNREYRLKAVYLYKFARYVGWPKEAFQNTDSPFVIGILGPDPFGNSLERIAALRKIGSRTIVVRNYELATEIEDCHVLFISKELEIERRIDALGFLAGRSILLVGETPGFLEEGGVINFTIQNKRIRNVISTSALRREKLEISSRVGYGISSIVP